MSALGRAFFGRAHFRSAPRSAIPYPTASAVQGPSPTFRPGLLGPVAPPRPAALERSVHSRRRLCRLGKRLLLSTLACRRRIPNSSSSSSSSGRSTNVTNAMAAEKTASWEKQIQRNPHPDFKQVEASRPPFDASRTFSFTQTPDPDWEFGKGANALLTPADAAKRHVAIDPHAPGRPAGFNYKLLISAVVPRPIAFLSTRSPDGALTNLAPFSYFQMIGHDPPLFVVGFSCPLDTNPDPAAGAAKDSLRNLHARGECVINMVSETFVEAANSTSINAPYGVSEWDVAGLTPAYDCETVGCARVREAVFAIEGRLESVREFPSRSTPGKVGATLAVIEGTRFWVREDAINEERNIVDPKALRPISRLGGITYGRVTEGLELPRPDFERDLGGTDGLKGLERKHLSN